MKRLIQLAFILLIGMQAQAQNKQESTQNFPIMRFETTHYDLGTLHEGDVVTRIYKFRNEGDVPLIITKIKASCGCTVPSNWKKEPILPGEKSEFTVKFNSKHKIHKQHKTITVYCNTKNKTERVFFTADVIPDPKMEKQRAERRKMYMERRKNKTNKKKHFRKPAVKKIPKGTPEYEAVHKKLVAKEKQLKKVEKKLKKEQKKLAKRQKKVNELRKQNNKLRAKVNKLKVQL